MTVELANKLDGTDRGDGRVESVDERWRTDGDVERNSGVEGDDGRTDEADGTDEGPAKDRRGQRTVDADGRSNSRQTQSSDEKLYIHSSADDYPQKSQLSKSKSRLSGSAAVDDYSQETKIQKRRLTNDENSPTSEH